MHSSRVVCVFRLQVPLRVSQAAPVGAVFATNTPECRTPPKNTQIKSQTGLLVLRRHHRVVRAQELRQEDQVGQALWCDYTVNSLHV